MLSATSLRRALPLAAFVALTASCTGGQTAGGGTATPSLPDGTSAPGGSTSSTASEPPLPVPTGGVSEQLPGVSPTPAPDLVVAITAADVNAATSSVEVSAYVTVVESDGACTLTLESAGMVVDATSSAYPDASSTSCDLLVVPTAELRPGTWQARVSYSSSTTTAVSVPQPIEVP